MKMALKKGWVILGVVITGLITLFFFPEPETNWIAYFSVFGLWILTIGWLLLNKMTRKKVSDMLGYIGIIVGVVGVILSVLYVIGVI